KPPGTAVMLGLVPDIIPSRQSVLPADPTVHRLLVLAWNAASKPPGTAVMLGLVPDIIPSCQSSLPADPTVQRLLVLAWKAASKPVAEPPPEEACPPEVGWPWGPPSLVGSTARTSADATPCMMEIRVGAHVRAHVVVPMAVSVVLRHGHG